MIQALSPQSRIDLHLHTDRSDGRFSAAQVLTRCAKAGLSMVALTDHDLGTELTPGVHRVHGRDLHVLGGAEVTGTHKGQEFHLLVYFPAEIPVGFHAFCQEQCRERATRYADTIANLGLSDLATPNEAALRGDRALTRLHLAAALVEAGHAKSRREAFQRFLGHAHRKVPSLALPFVEAIRLARAFGGLTSWAHPPPQAVRDHLGVFVQAGLQGLEGVRPHLRSKNRSFYRRMAHRYGLFITGGTDWHGWNEGELGLFQIQVRDLSDFVDVLRAA